MLSHTVSGSLQDCRKDHWCGPGHRRKETGRGQGKLSQALHTLNTTYANFSPSGRHRVPKQAEKADAWTVPLHRPYTPSHSAMNKQDMSCCRPPKYWKSKLSPTTTSCCELSWTQAQIGKNEHASVVLCFYFDTCVTPLYFPCHHEFKTLDNPIGEGHEESQNAVKQTWKNPKALYLKSTACWWSWRTVLSKSQHGPTQVLHLLTHRPKAHGNTTGPHWDLIRTQTLL